jgi:hypothetical protein
VECKGSPSALLVYPKLYLMTLNRCLDSNLSALYLSVVSETTSFNVFCDREVDILDLVLRSGLSRLRYGCSFFPHHDQQKWLGYCSRAYN